MTDGVPMGKPIVSVIMPAYNVEKYIADAIDSVIAQSFEDWELIIIDDCSSDKTADIIRAKLDRDTRIRAVFSEENHGVAYCRNLALDMCGGKYVALLDADDLWHPDKLKKQLKLAEETGADIIYCSYSMIDEHGEKCRSDFIVEEKTDYQKMLIKSVLSCSTVLLRHDHIANERFDSSIYHEDYLYWLSLLKNGCTARGCREPLADYRIVNGSRSNNKLRSAKKRWDIYRKTLKLPFAKSCILFAAYAVAGLKKYGM